MIRRDPQEIADFFGCYVAMDKDGDWFLYTKKPMQDDELEIWAINKEDCEILDIQSFVKHVSDHDWTKLYEPCVRNTYEKRMKNARITHESSAYYSKRLQ